ncbi:hypothetical protein GCM10019059_40950 [Camelimonas fluminis]|uniref:Macro domain-containing protein n=1 Tax=Camelimonas fluminis TaxID=1576911 RepID=A0ABV7UC19_9HYPH|nr:macro domain-containing protein [Camelimonas fluminis]GHE77768.1 hypothetical protein GCM10019059_40950 [Camelimonas fluminis]
MARVTYVTGNITNSSASLLVNTTNCVGVMGKGVALAFKQAFPHIMPMYQRDCRDGLIRPGTARIYELRRDPDRTSFWASLATKDHWRDPSRLEWIEPALQQLAIQAQHIGIDSIALPPPGCGNGGLDWRVVEPIVLRTLANFDLEIYARSTLGR